MLRLLLPLFLLLFYGFTYAADSAQREWKDVSGKVLAKGEFISLSDGDVCIMTPEGTGKTIPFEKLSAEDQKFVKNNGEDLSNIKGTLPEPEEIGTQKPREHQTPQTSAPKIPALQSLTLSDIQRTQPNSDLDIIGNDVITETEDGDEARGDIQVKVKDEKEKYAEQKRVVMFDFESLWDAELPTDYGGIMGNMFWMKLNREKGFIIPESMIDVRNICETYKIKPNPDTPLEKMKEYVTKIFNADIGIWGKIERVDKDVMEIYDFWLKVADFSVDPPKIIYEVNQVRTEAVAEVTGIYVRAAIEKLYNKQARTAAEKAEMETNWAKNPNLMEGGDFEKVSNNIPVGWENRCAQHREPIGRLVKRVKDPNQPENHFLHTEFDTEIAEGFGLMYYSKPFPIEDAAMYRIDYRIRKSKDVKAIVFIKCYDTIDTKFKPTADALKEGFTDKLGQQTREVYRSQQNHWSQDHPNEWIQHSQEFTPRHTKYSPKFGRVMIFGYYTAGSVDYDDFVLKKVKNADQEELSTKIKRHSLDTKVTLQEMEENERRGLEATKGMKHERKENPSEQKNKTKIK
ncbi:MAG: hypothetical protein LBU34_10615 [Planctomycetaceae bacterium]|jgi:hypothetical protein|nr:hypothetical protein [Planctomycetaceae bacterium]